MIRRLDPLQHAARRLVSVARLVVILVVGVVTP